MRKTPHLRVPASALLVIGSFTAVQAFAFDFDTGNTDLKIRWDNNLKYSSMWRLKDASSELVAELNQDDGDRNFSRGLVSNRVDLLSEMDVVYKDFGFRVSGAAWYDDIYNRSNDNDSPLTNNSVSVDHRHFTDDTEKLHGRKAELLDAFVFGRFDAGGMPLTLRAGKHTLVYGETLFFGSNGIAAAQGPVDAVKALSVPNTQFKELLMPVSQISGLLQLNSQFSIGAYYQFEWEKTRLPGVGSYFSTVDVAGEGAESLFVAPGVRFAHQGDIKAKDQGQGGVQLRWRPQDGDTEYGFYAVRYHDKTPQIYALPTIGTYRFVYPENIKSYGASFSTVLGDVNVAGEASYRDNMPLVSTAQSDLFGTADNDNKALYAVGHTAHANLSAIYALGGTSLFDSANIMGEVGWNRLLSVTKNRAALDPGVTRNAWGFRAIFEPSYYQVLPGWDVSVPIGLGYNPQGRSAVVGGFNGGVDDGGDLSIGVKGEYLKNLRISLNYTNFFGAQKTALRSTNIGYVQNFGQALADRDFVSFSAQYSF
ncbi:DUF1302 domain-containing protein [Pseudomonas aeruginosa]|uniref:DUF1302 domain-containing protein n=1 Tax=Pseudomonas TaxID=286 RepID=UPI001FFC712F|nr:DUF1302 domain-containing protein [Pseudomonas sp. PNPG3]MCK2119954.1 DUF1302 domain-containing protein [Pseudomonas sp. PNPG3]